MTGLIRTVGDGETIVFIQDLLVHPEYQQLGIGTSLIRAVLDRYNHVCQIQLTADDLPELASFYAALGFLPHSQFGCSGFMYSHRPILPPVD